MKISRLPGFVKILGFVVVLSALFHLYWAIRNARVGKPEFKASKWTPLQREFVVDWEHDRFLKDGKPFRFISGSFHYFRSHPKSWRRKLRLMRAAGLNAVATYVEWSLHNPTQGVYNWHGIANIEKFLRYAAKEDLLVILRAGPYIGAERDMGGLPYWLLTNARNITLRSTDSRYLNAVLDWFKELWSHLVPHLYGNGGPIIMVQLENEYGSSGHCDTNYMRWLKKETRNYVGSNAVLFTNNDPYNLPCGSIEGVLSTIDFGFEWPVHAARELVRMDQLNGPFVNMEFYTGWYKTWGESKADKIEDTQFIRGLVTMLYGGASVNFYMFCGGTNFEFTAGATRRHTPTTDIEEGRQYELDVYTPVLTSYDYGAPIDEAGDPTEKYFALQKVIGHYLPLPKIKLPAKKPKRHYGSVKLQKSCPIISTEALKILSRGTSTAKWPTPFEDLGQRAGFVLYETLVPKHAGYNATLHIEGLHDYAYVYVDGVYTGTLSRVRGTIRDKLRITLNGKRVLQLLVEGLGRVQYNYVNDYKGITGKVTLNNDIVLCNWNMTKLPLESFRDIKTIIKSPTCYNGEGPQSVPTIFHGSFIVDEVGDTYVDTTDWGKGILYVNGKNMGRYWPEVGPQMTLYVPHNVLKRGRNNIVLIESKRTAAEQKILLRESPIFITKLKNETNSLK